MKTKLLSMAVCIIAVFSVDLAYAYYPISPYAYVADNPVKYIDPDGTTIRISDYVDNQKIDYEWRDYQGTWGFYDSNNALYAGSNQFIGLVSGALNGLMNGGQTGFDLVSGLSNHSNVLTIWQRNSSGVVGNDVGWNPIGVRSDGSLEAVPTTAGMSNDPMMTLGHELGHIEYNWTGQQSSTWFGVPTATGNRNIPTSEIYTTHRENQLRSENGLPLRTHYGVDQYGSGMGPRIIIPSTGASRYYSSQGVTNYRPLKRGVTPYIY